MSNPTDFFLNFFPENLILIGVWFDLHIRLLFSNLSMWDVDLFLNNPPLKSRTFGPLPAKLWHLAPALLIHEIFLTHFSNRVILRAPPIPSMQPTPTFIGLLFDIGSDINWTFQGQVNSFVSMILSAFVFVLLPNKIRTNHVTHTEHGFLNAKPYIASPHM